MFKTTKALILREVKYKEADRILTVLTAEDGKQTVKAQGALRKTSKFGAATQVLTFSELTLFGNRGRWSVREGTVLDGFEGLRTDLESLSVAAYLAEVLEAVSDEDVPNPAVLQLGLNTNDLKLLTSTVVALFLAIPYWKSLAKPKKQRMGGDGHA